MNQPKVKYSLSNWDLVTVNPNYKTWNWKDLFCFWGANVQSLIGFSLISSLYLIYSLNVFVVFFGIILGSFVPEELGLKFAIPLTFIAIVIQDLKKIDHLIVMIVCGLSSLLFYDAPFRSYIIISPILALFVAALILRLKK